MANIGGLRGLQRKVRNIGSEQFMAEETARAKSLIDFSMMFAKPAVGTLKSKVAQKHGRAFSRKTGPLGLKAPAAVTAKTLRRG